MLVALLTLAGGTAWAQEIVIPTGPGTADTQPAGAIPSAAIPLGSNVNPVPEGEALLALYVDGVRFGDVEARIDLDDPFLRIDLLKEALTPSLSPAKFAEVFGIILSGLEWAGIADLKAAGITGTWDAATLSYNIAVPSEYSTLKEISFTSRSYWNIPEHVKPSFVAGVVNLNANASATWTETSFLAPFSISADGLLKIWEIAFEGSGSFSYRPGVMNTSLNKARAVLDIPAMESRMFLGRVPAEGISWQSRPELYGASIKNIQVFSRYERNAAPSVSFILQKPALVRIVSNGVIIRSLNLDKGKYRLYDLPFTFGLNDFQIEVEEDSDSGIKVFKPVETFVSTETGLLVGGYTEYGVSAGFGTVETDQFLGSGFVRHGLTYNFTGGLYFQADLRSALGGLTAVYASRIGGITAELGALAAWDGRADPFALAALFRYQYTFSSRTFNPSFGFEVQWFGKGFTAPYPLDRVETPESSLRLAANIGGRLPGNSSFGLSGNWTHMLTGTLGDSGAVSMNLGIPLASFTSLSLSSSVNFPPSARPDFQLTLMLYLADPANTARRLNMNQGINGTNGINFSDRIAAFGGTTNVGFQAQNLAAGASAPTSLAVSAGSSLAVADIAANASTYFGGPTGARGGSATLYLATAIAFAGKSFGMSRPLNDAFIVFDPDKTTGKMPVTFGTEGGGKVESRGGPVVLPLTSYRPLRAFMDFPEADADVIATVPESLVSPKYRSGFFYQAGLMRKYYVSGRLVDAAGKPRGYVPGEILDAAGTSVDVTFTDEDGTFQVYGLVPGSYTINWPEDIGTTSITLGSDVNGYIDLGQVTAAPVPVPEAAPEAAPGTAK